MRDSEYETLLSKYNMAVALNRDLREQMETKDRQRQDYEEKCDIVDKHARELCEKILAKDRIEMTLGDAKTWHSISTDDMIKKAMASFARYCQERTELLNKVMKIAEQRGLELESLKDQISRLMRNGNAGALASADEMLQQAEKEREVKEIISKAPNSTQKAIAEGRVEAIIEENDECEDKEIEAIQQMIEISNQAKLTERSIPVVRTPQKSELIKKADEAAIQPHMIRLDKIMEQYGDAEWNVLQVIGKLGLSKTQDILSKCHEIFPDDTDWKSRKALNTLRAAGGPLDSMSVTLPISKHNILVKLNDIGERIYETHFGEKPVKAEMDAVRAEHDNPEHGYGILDLKKLLEETGRYESVSCYNRQSPFNLEINGVALKYIPDLICKGPKFTDYYEYERANHLQSDFNMKCNKMCKVTRFLNFVTDNIKSTKKINEQVKAWIATRKPETLKGITVRIGTADSIRNNGKWLVVYNLNKGTEPITDLTV